MAEVKYEVKMVDQPWRPRYVQVNVFLAGRLLSETNTAQVVHMHLTILLGPWPICSEGLSRCSAQVELRSTGLASVRLGSKGCFATQ